MSFADGMEIAFFDTYRDAFNRADQELLVDLFDAPAFVVSDEGSANFPDRMAVRDGIASLLSHYKRAGVGEVQHDIIATREISEKIRQVEIGWRLVHQNGQTLWSFSVIYYFRLGARGWRIVSMVNPTGN